MKISTAVMIASMAMLLSACGGSSSSGSADSTDEPTNEVQIYGPFSTGTASEPATVYYDLDNQAIVEITDDEALTDTTWDIAFRRTNVWLNTAQPTPVSIYFTGNNSDFYNTDGAAIADLFTSATAESELEDFTMVTLSDVPDAEAFSTDEEASVIGDSFYNYDITTHTVTAAEETYYILSSDQNYTKFRVTDIQTVGRFIGDITFEIAHQSTLDGQSEFASPIALSIQTEACTDDTYIDFDTQTTATEAEDWDLMLTCADGGASFSITLADDATVIRTDGETYSGVDSAAAPFMGFTADAYTEYAFNSNLWYYYDGSNHLLYSQYGVYLIQVGDVTYKFQITSYYDDEGTSGNYSFRAEALTE